MYFSTSPCKLKLSRLQSIAAERERSGKRAQWTKKTDVRSGVERSGEWESENWSQRSGARSGRSRSRIGERAESAARDCQYLVIFRRHSRSKCDVVGNRTKKHVFGLQIFFGERYPEIWIYFLKFTLFRSCGKVSRRSAERPRRTRAEEKN